MPKALQDALKSTIYFNDLKTDVFKGDENRTIISPKTEVSIIVELYALSDVGRVRRSNADNYLILDLSGSSAWTGTDGAEPPDTLSRLGLGLRGLVLAVSDGMDDALAGHIASHMAVETVRGMLSVDDDDDYWDAEKQLVDYLRHATVYSNLAIYHRSQEDTRCAGMGATFTGAAIKDGLLDLVQVGDSRAYIIRGQQIRLATKDQSLVQQLVDVGRISEAEAETYPEHLDKLIQALGQQSELTPVSGRIRLCAGDVLLLCSRGLSSKLRADDMYRIIRDSTNLESACHGLVTEANERGGEENITVILAKFTGHGLPIPRS